MGAEPPPPPVANVLRTPVANSRYSPSLRSAASFRVLVLFGLFIFPARPPDDEIRRGRAHGDGDEIPPIEGAIAAESNACPGGPAAVSKTPP